jgi:hypothetical protein
LEKYLYPDINKDKNEHKNHGALSRDQILRIHGIKEATEIKTKDKEALSMKL